MSKAAANFVRSNHAGDESLSQAVLNALPHAIFLLDIAAGTLTPQNAAAGAASNGELESPVIDLADVFPELDLAALRGATGGYLHTRVAGDIAGASGEALVQVFPLAHEHVADTKANFSPAQLVIVVRPMSHQQGAIANDLNRRDAWDDAFHDPLTRLPNRQLFQRRLERAIHRHQKSDYHFAVLFVDLDRFKEVNDRFGHLQGDKVLVAAAHRLVEAVRPQDMVARRDGDEFTILLDDLDQPEDAVGVAERIIEHLRAPLTIESPAASPTQSAALSILASVGVALAGSRDGTQTVESLVARADAAMYHAKALGGGTFVTLDHSAEAGGLSPGGEKPLPR